MPKTSINNPNPLTLEDVALLADGADGLPAATKRRLRELVMTDPRFQSQLEHLEALAQESGLGEEQGRFGSALLVRDHYLQLEQAEGWEHPAEVLDPEGFIGLLYQELLHLAVVRARDTEDSSPAWQIARKLEAAWAEEQARRAFADRMAKQLLDFDPEEAESLLLRVGHDIRWRYRQLRQAGEEVS